MTISPIFMKWLSDHPSVIWFDVVGSWGEWDGDISPIEWIARQPRCDRATAVHMLEHSDLYDVWCEQPNRAAAEQAFKSEDAMRLFDLSEFIIQKWRTTGFDKANYKAPGLNLIYLDTERGKELPRDMFDNFDGPDRDWRTVEDRMNRDLRSLGLSKFGTGAIIVC
ncbi:MAG: hypothetical protein ACT4N2_01150 [Hyphomicrobium sp.]